MLKLALRLSTARINCMRRPNHQLIAHIACMNVLWIDLQRDLKFKKEIDLHLHILSEKVSFKSDLDKTS